MTCLLIIAISLKTFFLESYLSTPSYDIPPLPLIRPHRSINQPARSRESPAHTRVKYIPRLPVDPTRNHRILLATKQRIRLMRVYKNLTCGHRARESSCPSPCTRLFMRFCGYRGTRVTGSLWPAVMVGVSFQVPTTIPSLAFPTVTVPPAPEPPLVADSS